MGRTTVTLYYFYGALVLLFLLGPLLAIIPLSFNCRTVLHVSAAGILVSMV